jgi:hypothetical protein
MADQVEKEKEGAEGAAPGAQGEKKEVPFNEHPRWKEVYGELQEFKKLAADPGTLNARLQEANEIKVAFEEAVALAHAEQAKTEGQRKADESYKLARQELKKIFPEIDQLAGLQQAQQERWTRLERAAIGQTQKVMAAAGLDTSPGEIKSMTDVLADIIKNDADLHAEYDIDPRAAVNGAFEKFQAKFAKVGERASKAASQREREATRSLPRAHGSGGVETGGGEKAAAPAKNLAEASARVAARLKGMDLGEL